MSNKKIYSKIDYNNLTKINLLQLKEIINSNNNITTILDNISVINNTIKIEFTDVISISEESELDNIINNYNYTPVITDTGKINVEKTISLTNTKYLTIPQMEIIPGNGKYQIIFITSFMVTKTRSTVKFIFTKNEIELSESEIISYGNISKLKDTYMPITLILNEEILLNDKISVKCKIDDGELILQNYSLQYTLI